MECKLNSFNKDPDEWLMNLENLKWKLKGMGHEVSDEDMMVHILHNLPKEYENTIEIMEIELKKGEMDWTLRIAWFCSPPAGWRRCVAIPS